MYRIYADHQESFYCHCQYDQKKHTSYSSCGYHIRKDQKRAGRIEAEHIVPAWTFGHQLACWQQKICTHPKTNQPYGGRSCCRLKDPYFRQMENDLHNLVPAIGEVNGDRHNYQFKDWHGSATQYGQCAMLIDFKHHLAQPPEETKGFIARTYLYMYRTYHIPLSDLELKQFQNWAALHPESHWEKIRNARIR